MSADNPSATLCPSCGRYVGALEKCPHCGASVRKRLPIRTLRLGSIVLALAGIAALLYAVSGAATPKLSIANIEATMNYAYVRVEGTVTRGPNYNPDTQELKFYIADATGEIPVASFRATTRQLLDAKKIPVAGDHALVEGTLRVREDFISMNLPSADKLTLTHPNARALKISEIDKDRNLQIVSITGDVREVHSPYKGLNLITVGDATGEIDVALSSDIIALSGNIPEVQIGDAVQVSGTVTFYKDQPQLALTNARDLIKADAGSAPVTTTRIADLDLTRVGGRVQVAGEVKSAKKFSQGLRVILDDGSGAITLLVWKDLLEQLANADQVASGAHIQIVGKLSQYRGDLEITPSRAGDIQVVMLMALQDATPGATPDASPTATPTRTPTPAPVQRTIGSLSGADENRIIIVSGRITKTTNFSQGVRLTLDDGTGTITLILFSDVLSNVKNSIGLTTNARVQATGKVNIFNRALEIVPSKGSDVVLLALSVVPTPATRTIASLNSNDVGTTVLVSGTVRKIEDFSKGKYITLDDSTGQIRVTVFSTVLNVMPDKAKLIAGASITVRAPVNLYRGEFELVPEKGGITIQ